MIHKSPLSDEETGEHFDVIYCGGDALIDFVPVTMGRETAFVPRVGGAMMNVATALARLGDDVEFIGDISLDLFGDILTRHMHAEGIGTKFVRQTGDDSTLAFVTLEDGDARYAFFDRTSARRNWSGIAGDIDGDAVHIGSLSYIAEPAAAAWLEFARTARERMIVSLDPNCRPSLVKDAKTYRRYVKEVSKLSHIIRMSDEDLEFVHPVEEEEDVAAHYLAGETQLFLISRGGYGASAYWAGGRIDVESRPVSVTDSIGAGDTFDAGILSALSESGHLTFEGLGALTYDVLESALEFASVAASLNCEKTGCDPPTKDAVQAALNEL